MRSSGACLNGVKCPELGQLLYDWFIDCIQTYNARVNHGLFLFEARYLRQRLLDAGYEPQTMPKLEGEAGKSWFRRWRKQFCVVSRNGETSKGVAEQIEAASASLFEECVFFATFMAPLLRRQTDEMGVLGPKTRLVQQYSLGR